MKTFLVVEKQGEGCDYTIGCGVKTYTVEAESYEALMDEVNTFLNTCNPDYLDEHDLAFGLSYTGESERSAVTVYEVAVSYSLNLDTFREVVERRRRADADETKEAKERAELKRLQEKFG